MLTRRGFLGAVGGIAAGAGAGVIAGAGGAGGCGDNAEPDRFAGFSIGIQSWTFRSFSLEEMLDMAARLGLAHVELTPGHLQFPASDAEIDALRAAVAARGLRCLTAHVAPVGVDYPVDRAACVYGKRLGLHTVMATEVPADGAVLDAIVAELDVKIGLHNHTGSRFDRVDAIQAELAGRDPRVGTIIDTGHYTRVGLDPAVAIRAFAGRIHGLHLKDVAAPNPAAPDAIVGEGVVDLVGIFRALREVGLASDATISIEYESNPAMPFDDIARSLDHVAEAAYASLRG